MMVRWRQAATFGLIENKLLGHSVLKSLGIAQAPLIYGAFGTKAMGEWPHFHAASFTRLITQLAGREDSQFVVKSATNGGSKDVLIVGSWLRDATSMKLKIPRPGAAEVARWATERVCAFLSRPFSEWGQRYELRGVIVQSSVLDRALKYAFELKVHCIFGQLGGGGIYPMNGGRTAYFNFVPAKVHCSEHNRWNRSLYCENIVIPLLRRVSGRLRAIARTIAHAFAADWFRLDVFLLQRPGDNHTSILVNEVSYPGHADPGISSLSRLNQAYRSSKSPVGVGMTLVDGNSIVRSLLQRINVSTASFNQTDYRRLHHASEREYASDPLQRPLHFECTHVPFASDQCSTRSLQVRCPRLATCPSKCTARQQTMPPAPPPPASPGLLVVP